MSVDFYVNDKLKTRGAVTANLLNPQVRHLMLCFHGDPNADGEATDLENDHPLRQLKRATVQHFFKKDEVLFIMHWKAKIKANWTDKPMTYAAEQIQKLIDPRGCLIVAGTSAGAVTALDFCRGIEANMKYLEFGSELVPQYSNFTSKGNPKLMGKVTNIANDKTAPIRVDRLYTLDAAFSVIPATRNRQNRVPAIVRKSLNFYQTKTNTTETDLAKLVMLDRTEEFHSETFPAPDSGTVVLQRDLTMFVQNSPTPHNSACFEGWRQTANDIFNPQGGSGRSVLQQPMSPQNRTFLDEIGRQAVLTK